MDFKIHKRYMSMPVMPPMMVSMFVTMMMRSVSMSVSVFVAAAVSMAMIGSVSLPLTMMAPIVMAVSRYQDQSTTHNCDQFNDHFETKLWR